MSSAEGSHGPVHGWMRSNIVGLVAIFIALSGTAVATQVARDAGGAENAAKKKPKRGPQGPAGPAGPQGIQGVPGPLSGAAGGDLAGNYPNPDVASGAITDTEVAPHAAIAADKLAISGAILSGKINGLSSGSPLGQEFAGVTGITSATSVEADVEILSPNRALVAQNLAMRVTTPPGNGNLRSFFLLRDNFFAVLACEVYDANTSCNSGANTAQIPAASRLSFVIFNSDGGTPGDFPPMSATFGIELR